MPKGGARPRSGPASDPNSGRSERARAAAKKTAAAKTATTRTVATKKTTAAAPASSLPITVSDFNPLALPARGRTGRAPAFPLPKIHRFVMVDVGEGKPQRQVDAGVSNEFRKRELAIWAELWKTPQAVAWERDPWRWATVAKYCRIMTATESEPDASAALLSRERELRIECGLTADGLKVNGWAIAPDQLAEKRAAKKTAAKTAEEDMPPLRLQR